MTLRIVRATLVALVPAVALACTDGARPPDGVSGPTLSLSGATAVTGPITRSITELRAGSEIPLATTDTAVWAPFDDGGWAFAGEGAGSPGPLGALYSTAERTRELPVQGEFTDDEGVRHELLVTGGGSGPWTKVTYTRAGAPVLRFDASWTPVQGGWILTQAAATYQLRTGSAVRVAVASGGLTVASRKRGGDALLAAAGWLGGVVSPRPLHAQFYFLACDDQWLAWLGAFLIADYYWTKFIETKSINDLKKALAATAVAGAALKNLVNCMLSQPEEPA
jgi:hypothetical protein